MFYIQKVKGQVHCDIMGKNTTVIQLLTLMTDAAGFKMNVRYRRLRILH